MWIEKKEDGTLIVPLRAEGEGIIGDGVVEVKKDNSHYKKYLKLYEEEQKRRK